VLSLAAVSLYFVVHRRNYLNLPIEPHRVLFLFLM